MPMGSTVRKLLEAIATEVREANSTTADVLLSNIQTRLRQIQKYADLADKPFDVVRDVETKVQIFAVGLQRFGDARPSNNSPVEYFRSDAFDALDRLGLVLNDATPSETARALGID